MIADPSLATMYSPLPMPTISGLPFLATTIVSGSPETITAIAYAPVTSRSAAWTADSRSIPPDSAWSASYNSLISVASTSVSVSVLNFRPFSSSSRFSDA